MKHDDEVKQRFRWEAKEGRHQHALNYPGWRYNNPNPGASTSVFEKDDRSAAQSKEVIMVLQSRPKLATPRLSSSLRGLSTLPNPLLASPSSSLSSFKSSEISTPPTCISFTLNDGLVCPILLPFRVHTLTVEQASSSGEFTPYWWDRDCLPNLQTFIEEPQTGFEVKNAATMWSDVDRLLSPLILPQELPGLGFNYTTGNDLIMPLFGLSMEYDFTITELDLLIGDEMSGFPCPFSDDDLS